MRSAGPGERSVNRLIGEEKAGGLSALQGAYLSDEEACCYCDSSVDDAERTLFVCDRWSGARDAASGAVGVNLTPDTMVLYILQSEIFWKHIKSFITLVMKTKDLDGPVKPHRDLHPRLRILDGLGSRTSLEKNLCAFLAGATPGFAERARGRVSGERTTEESFTT